MVKRIFQIELDVPADFDTKYYPPKQIWRALHLMNDQSPPLGWLLASEAKQKETGWQSATQGDVGKTARFRNNESDEWWLGQLLHVDEFGPENGDAPYLTICFPESGIRETTWYWECEVQL